MEEKTNVHRGARKARNKIIELKTQLTIEMANIKR